MNGIIFIVTGDKHHPYNQNYHEIIYMFHTFHFYHFKNLQLLGK